MMYSYGYSKERFVWSLISAVGIFCLGSGATIVNGIQNLWTSQVINNGVAFIYLHNEMDCLFFLIINFSFATCIHEMFLSLSLSSSGP